MHGQTLQRRHNRTMACKLSECQKNQCWTSPFFSINAESQMARMIPVILSLHQNNGNCNLNYKLQQRFSSCTILPPPPYPAPPPL